jgi:hypothetical protein
MSRIQRVSTYLIWVFNIILVLIPISSLFMWLGLDDPSVQSFLKPLMDHNIFNYSDIKTP